MSAPDPLILAARALVAAEDNYDDQSHAAIKRICALLAQLPSRGCRTSVGDDGFYIQYELADGGYTSHIGHRPKEVWPTSNGDRICNEERLLRAALSDVHRARAIFAEQLATALGRVINPHNRDHIRILADTLLLGWEKSGAVVL
jgi:hypothetical protein